MRFDVAGDLLRLMRQRGVTLTSAYERVIGTVATEGFSYCTPAMFGITETLFSNKLMIAHNMLQNAVDEAKGAARVNVIAQKYADPVLHNKMKRHVSDELRHSRMFAESIALTGFRIEKEDEAVISQAVDDVLVFDDDLITFLCRVHSIEVRSWTMLRLYVELLRSKEESSLKSIASVLQRILADETYHVQYTCGQINEWLDDGLAAEDTLLNCFRHTNRETWHDMANMADYLADNYPALNSQSTRIAMIAA